MINRDNEKLDVGLTMGRLNWLLMALLSVLLVGCSKAPTEPKLLADTANQVMSPLYAELNSQTQQLLQQSQAFCQAPSEQTQQQLQQQWRDTMNAWARVQPIGFGPVETGNLRWKIQFWPDRKDLTSKKTEALIRSDETLTAERVAAASVSVQGLAALEYLLFDERVKAVSFYQQNSRRCELLQAIAERVHQVTQQVEDEWPDFAAKFAQPSVDNPLYPDNKAALAELLNTLVVGVEVVKRNKLGLPIANGANAQHAKPYRLEAWRSQYSLALMRASTETLEQLYRGNGGFGLSAYLQEQDAVDDALLGAIDEAFAAVNTQFAAIEAPLFTQIKQPEYYAQLTNLRQRLDLLQRQLAKLPEKLDISLGFNSNDGD